MSKLNIACFISPMIDTEGPMHVASGKVLDGAKADFMGRYGEMDLETAISFGEAHPDAIHLDVLSAGKSKLVTKIQQNAIAMVKPAKHPGSLGVHALELEDIDDRDAFEVAGILTAMVGKLDAPPDMILLGRESMDYTHGIVGPALAESLGMAYYSGVYEISINDDFKSVTATFMRGNDRLVLNIPLPVVFGTTDWLNGKDQPRFTSLQGVMMAKRFKRNVMSPSDLVEGVTARTAVLSIDEVKRERKNHRIEEGEGPEKVDQAMNLLLNVDKAFTASGGGEDDGATAGGSVNWSSGDVGALDLTHDVVVVADHAGGKLKLSTLQILSPARAAADKLGKKLSLLVMGEEIDGPAAMAAGYGVDRVVGLKTAQLANATLETHIHLIEAILGQAPGFLFMVADDMGRDLAAFLAAKYKGGLLQSAAELDVEDGRLIGRRLVANARFMSREEIKPGLTCQIATLRPTSFDPSPREGDTAYVSVDLGELPAARASIKDFIAGAEQKGIPLNEAKVVVAAGRGMKSKENLACLQELAELLGGAFGASRAVTDAEWAPHNLQIGQTGCTVAPELYIAVGISGAIQHLTGMLDSKYIISINSDPEAPIHQVSDISIVDKWQNVIEPLTQAFKKVL